MLQYILCEIKHWDRIMQAVQSNPEIVGSPEIIPTIDGRFILKLTKEMTPPSDCKRISDIDVEKLTVPAEK